MYLVTVNKDLTSYNIFAAKALTPMTAPGCVTDYLHATIDNMHVACPSSPGYDQFHGVSPNLTNCC